MGTRRNEPAAQTAKALVEQRVRFPAAPLRECWPEHKLWPVFLFRRTAVREPTPPSVQSTFDEDAFRDGGIETGRDGPVVASHQIVCTRRSRDGPGMRLQPVDDFRSLLLIEQVAGLSDVFAAQLDRDVPIQFRLFFAARCEIGAEELVRERFDRDTAPGGAE